MVTAEDAAGNFSTRDSKTLIIHADTSISAPGIELDASTDTAGGPAGTVGDDYTGYVDGNPANDLSLAVSADDNATVTVYLLDPTAPGVTAIVSNGVTIGTGVLIGTSVQDMNDDWPLVSFDASGYAGTETTLTFVAVAEDKAGKQRPHHLHHDPGRRGPVGRGPSTWTRPTTWASRTRTRSPAPRKFCCAAPWMKGPPTSR